MRRGDQLRNGNRVPRNGETLSIHAPQKVFHWLRNWYNKKTGKNEKKFYSQSLNIVDELINL